jgi:glycosyltransferase involved in cell wall biosynthesis
MRIAVDARKLHDYGIGTYVRNVLKQLARQDQTNEYVVICRPEHVGLSADLGPNFRDVADGSKPYSLAEQVSIPMDLRRHRIDLFHEPHYVLPPLVPCPSVVTIHDCIHLRFPQYLPNRLAHAYARTFLWTATHQADRIITVSEASKRDILQYFRIPPEKIEVIYNGIGARFWEPPSEPGAVDRCVPTAPSRRVRSAQAPDYRRRDFEIRHVATRRASSQTAQARAVPRLRSR